MMRDQGRLVEWFDEKGYGFIQPNEPDKGRVFLHIKDFARPGPRPIIGCALEYLVILDAQGRYRAQQVTYLTAAQARKKPARQQTRSQSKKALQPFQLLIAVYFIMLGIVTACGLINGLLLLFTMLMNVATYWFYAQDKEAAQAGRRRISEQTLHILSFLGGWPAAWLAQQKLRHKTQKQPFRKIYWITIVLNILLVLWLISPLNPY